MLIKEKFMYTIEVDFEVYKQLTMRRTTEDVSYNDVVRGLLGLVLDNAISLPGKDSPSSEDWIAKDVRFPVGTEFRARYKGKVHTARVAGGALVLAGRSYTSPSPAAMSITGSSLNGWDFWECRLPGKTTWQLMNSLRRSNGL
jgi:Protein of unknown function (DUF2924)